MASGVRTPWRPKSTEESDAPATPGGTCLRGCVDGQCQGGVSCMGSYVWYMSMKVLDICPASVFTCVYIYIYIHSYIYIYIHQIDVYK